MKSARAPGSILDVGWRKTSIDAPPLIGPRFYIRPPRSGDWREWADLRLFSRDFLTPWEPTWPGDALSKASFRQRLRRNARDWRDDKAYALFLFTRDDDDLIGGLTLSGLRRGVTQSASLGYWIGKPYAGQGYMSEAVLCVLDFAFDTLGLHRVEAACVPDNEASRRLLVKCGFTQEGLGRAYLRINGDWRDHLLFAILNVDRRPG